MKRLLQGIGAVLLLAVAYLVMGPEAFEGGSDTEATADSRPAPSSGTAPERSAEAARVAVDEAHIFEGEINRRGKAVGFHSRPGGRDRSGARLVRVLDGPNRLGVYTARVEIRDPQTGEWKGKFSSFFPDSMSHGEILEVIYHAYAHRSSLGGDRWRGPSGRGFQVDGYFQQGRIRTAYPIFEDS